jgi:hypothetical protein
MKIRGDRECKNCGSQWSYYEIGSITCPECGSPRSVGIEDRKVHTDSPVSLDLTDVRKQIDDAELGVLAEQAAATCRSYVQKRGFIEGGELKPLDDSYLSAAELVYVGADVDRQLRTSDDEEYYLLELLRGADRGKRPKLATVPDSLRGARGLAYATAVDDYRTDLRTYLDEHPDEAARNTLSQLRTHQKRVEALDGDVSVSTAETLVGTAQSLGVYLIDTEETALAQARHQLETLDEGP